MSIIRRFYPAVALAGSLLLFAGCGGDRPASQGTPAATTSKESASAPMAADATFAKRMRTTQTVPFEHAWDLQLPAGVHASWIGGEIPDLLFVQVTGTNAIYAVDALSGKTRWVSQPLPAPITLAPHAARLILPSGRAGETVADDRLYFVSDDIMFCLDGVYGEVIWRYSLPFSTGAGPQAVGVDGNLRVFLGDWAGRVQVLTWTPKNGLAYQLWQYPVFAPVTAPAVAYENLVYVGDQGGKVSCFDLERELKWQTKLGGKILGSPTPISRLLYVGSTDNVFYCLNRLSGEELARVHMNAPVTRAPFHFREDPGLVYTWTDHADPSRGGLWCFEARGDQIDLTHNLDAQNRPRKKEVIRLSQRWFVPAATRLISSSPEHLFVTGANPALVQAINRKTGATDWAWNLNDGRTVKNKVVHVTAYQDPSDFTRAIMVVGADNRIDTYRLYGGRDVGVIAPQ